VWLHSLRAVLLPVEVYILPVERNLLTVGLILLPIERNLLTVELVITGKAPFING
jgi:hypothetical protein